MNTTSLYGPSPVWAPGGADWAWWVAAGVAGAMALWLLWHARLRDRARGTARCPKCWYDMAGHLPENESDEFTCTCPECGRSIAKRKQLFKSRRRWWAAWLGVACVLLAVSGGLLPRVRNIGLVSLMPTTALLRLEGLGPREVRRSLDDPASPAWSRSIHQFVVSRELVRRDPSRDLAAWQWRMWVRDSGILDPTPHNFDSENDPVPAGYDNYIFGNWMRDHVLCVTFEDGIFDARYDPYAEMKADDLQRNMDFFWSRHEAPMYRGDAMAALRENAQMWTDNLYDRYPSNDHRMFEEVREPFDARGVGNPSMDHVIWISGLGGTSNSFPRKAFAGVVPDAVRCRVEIVGVDPFDPYYLDLGWMEIQIECPPPSEDYLAATTPGEI